MINIKLVKKLFSKIKNHKFVKLKNLNLLKIGFFVALLKLNKRKVQEVSTLTKVTFSHPPI